jgi:SAM-dependent methyltransferase
MSHPTSTTDEHQAAHAGQAVYSPIVLALYDFWVLGVSNHLAWSCPTRRLLDIYDAHVTPRHLEVGVGSGYYLERCTWPKTGLTDLCLLDLNPNSLAYASRRVSRLAPRTLVGNALEPFALESETFTSIGITYLFHCLPGDMPRKSVVFEHAHRVLAPGGVVFGATILGAGVAHNAFGRGLIAVYNRKGIFSNLSDSRDALEKAIASSFSDFSVDTVGRVAVFVARKTG